MTRTQYLLARVAEEAAEVAQRALKAQAYGINEVQPEQARDNAERLIQEFNELIAVMQMLRVMGAIPHIYDEKAMAAKKEKVEHFMNYARMRGEVE